VKRDNRARGKARLNNAYELGLGATGNCQGAAVAGDNMVRPPNIVGVGGSLRVGSTSRTALATVLEGAAAVGAGCRLIWVRDLDLPRYSAEGSAPLQAQQFADLTNKPVGLVSTAGGVHGLQAINSMDFIARALRGRSVPLVQRVAQARQSFDPEGRLVDQVVGDQLRGLGQEVVRAARQFRAEGTWDYADDRQFAQATPH
jgi:FMN reductase